MIVVYLRLLVEFWVDLVELDNFKFCCPAIQKSLFLNWIVLCRLFSHYPKKMQPAETFLNNINLIKNRLGSFFLFILTIIE